MQTLRFYKVSPGGNATILILDPVLPPLRAGVAGILMSRDHLQAEQVGYLDLTASPARLDMMGGEFCGNACRAAAAVMVREGVGMRMVGREWQGVLSVSGASDPVRLKVTSGPDGSHCAVSMPMPDKSRDFMRECGPGMGVISLPGITHLCLDEDRHAFPSDHVRAAEMLRQEHGLTGDAVGCIWYTSGPSCRIKPVVWVRSTGTTHYETGCGSGSLAVALWLSRGQNFPTALSVVQPSGREIAVRMDSALEVWISGPVSVVAGGEAYIAEPDLA